MNKRFVSFIILVFIILSPVVAGAQDGNSFYRINKGEESPFSGFLLSDSGLSKLLADKKADEQKCLIKIERQKELLQKEVEKQQKIREIEVKILKEKHENILKIKNKQILSYENIVKEQKKGILDRFKTTSFWTGVAIGFALSSITTTVIVLAR